MRLILFVCIMFVTDLFGWKQVTIDEVLKREMRPAARRTETKITKTTGKMFSQPRVGNAGSSNSSVC